MVALGLFDICEPGGSGMLLPLFEAEQTWPRPLRGVIYAVVMVYCFLGVSIIADMFMDAITVITSRRRRVRLSCGRMVTHKVWNETVATLSLMALGSSAPEICLSTIELLKRSFHVGGLGPSTIIGSAAFNLLVIIAVCMASIPPTEVRRIHKLPVFYITALFSVVAYLWLTFILNVNSVDIVDIWEASVTFALLPFFVWISYKTDTGDLMRAARWLASRVSPLLAAGETDNKENDKKDILSFSAETMTVNGMAVPRTVEVQVCRSGDCKGRVGCNYRTERFSAVPGYDYEEADGQLEFADGENQVSIELCIPPRDPCKVARNFFVVLEETTGGAEFNPEDDGGEESAILTVTVAPGSNNGTSTGGGGPVSLDSLRLGFSDWGSQSVAIFYCLGSPEEQRNAKLGDWVYHVASLPWKLLFLPVPPTSLLGGWPCFWCSLGFIALLTAVLSDLAEFFGCVCSIPDIVTAVTFVALGTSMPDLFASLSATRDDPTADAAIVNVTGSNSVNVYLGLGLPWTMGAIYWAVVGRTPEWEEIYSELDLKLPPGNAGAFVVDSKNLGFSVLVFSLSCIVALILLFVRRHFLGAEFGGPRHLQVVTCISFVSMWFAFCGIVSWRVLTWKEISVAESGAVMGGVGGFEAALAFAAIALTVQHGRRMAAARACAEGVSGGAGLRRSYSGVSGGSAHSVPEEAHEMVKATRRGALKELKERKTSTSHASDASGASMKRGASFMSAASSGALYVSEEQTVPEVTPTQKLAGASAGSGGASPSPPEVIPTQKPAGASAGSGGASPSPPEASGGGGASLNRGASFASAGSSSVANPSQEQTVVEVSAPQQLSGTSATVASSGGEPAELAEPAEVSALQQPSDAAASAGGEPVEPPEVSAVQQPPGTSASAGDEPAEPAVATEV